MAEIETGMARKRRHARVRAKVKGTTDRPRLAVFRSLNNIYAQVIDDGQGTTMACASSLDSEIREGADAEVKTARAGRVGSLIAKRTLEQGIKQVVFDRGGYKYHGRVKALAEAARQGGLKF